jgi:hypothetical protein
MDSGCGLEFSTERFVAGKKSEARVTPALNERENTKDNFESTRKGICRISKL